MNYNFKKGRLFFCNIPLDDIKLYIKTITFEIPNNLCELYMMALKAINDGKNINFLPNTIKYWMIAYRIQDNIDKYYNNNNIDLFDNIITKLKQNTDDRELSDIILSYFHISGYMSPNIFKLNYNIRYNILVFKIYLDLIQFNIPDELILLSIINKKDKVNKNVEDVLYFYGDIKNDTLAHIGDRVIEIIVSDMVLQYDCNVNNKTRLLVANLSFKCYMDTKNLCKFVNGGLDPTDKLCADVFEAIIGTLFYWYNNILKHSTTIKTFEKLVN